MLTKPQDRSAVAGALASLGDVIESGTGPAARVLRSEEIGSNPDQKESAQ